MFRNGWSLCSGMGGHNAAESVVSLERNEWSQCGGIRTKVSGPCSKYLKLTDISRLKDLKAHVIWNDNGRNENNPHEKQLDDYFNGCDQLIQFCGDLPWKSKKCTFNKVLKKVDRRQKSPNRRKASADRRNYKGPIKKVETIDMRIIRDRRWTTDRRVCDHRGLWAATCLV